MSGTLGLIVLTLTCMLLSWSLPAVAFETTTTGAPCTPGYYTCETGYCIPNSLLCDGITDCIGGSDERGCSSTTSPGYFTSSYTTEIRKQPPTTSKTRTKTTQSTIIPTDMDCPLPFQSVGGRCVFVDSLVEGTWPEMRYRCEEFGAVLLEVDEPNFFLSVVQFIKEKGLESASYWIGGRKDADEDLYYWDGSRTNVTVGTPFWAIYKMPGVLFYEQEPDVSGAVEQCVLLNKERGLYFSDMNCDATVAAVVCQRDPGPVDSPADLVKQCYLDNFVCDYTTCVSTSKVCDGVKNCPNNADEAYCRGARSNKGVSLVCGDDFFECDNGYCIWNQWVCDGGNDCMDFSDEINCPKPSTTTVPTTTTSTTTVPTTTTSTTTVPTTTLSTSTVPKSTTSTTRVPTTTSSSTVPTTTPPQTTSPATRECSPSPPYQTVGGKCIFVEPFVQGSWQQMRYRCEEFGGILLEMEDPNFFWAVVEFIIENGIDMRDYWIGARKDANDDVYYWDGSSTNVTMGTPFWTIYESSGSGPYGQEPYAAVEEQCVFLNKDRKLLFSSTDCDVVSAGVICQRSLDQS